MVEIRLENQLETKLVFELALTLNCKLCYNADKSTERRIFRKNNAEAAGSVEGRTYIFEVFEDKKGETIWVSENHYRRFARRTR